MKHTIVALMEDRPGALNRAVSLFRRRNFNIESLTVGHTDQPKISRMTVVVEGDEAVVEQVVKQLYKLIDVIKVSDVSADQTVVRELALIKVAANSVTRSEIMQIVDIFRAKIVDVAMDSLMVEVTGQGDKIDSLVNLLRGFGIKEMVRTGVVAMVRGASGETRIADDEDEAPRVRGGRSRRSRDEADRVVARVLEELAKSASRSG